MRTFLWICAISAASMAVVGWPKVHAAPASAATVRASVVDTNVTAGSQFMLNIEINGRAGGLPVMPQVDGLNIGSQPSTHSSRTEFSGGSNIVSIQKLGYVVYATKAGKITIPPITITVDGKPLTTEAIELTVTEATVPQAGARQPRQTLPRQPGFPQPQQPQQPPQQANQDDGLTLEQAVFIESRVDKTQVYQGEPLQQTLVLWMLKASGFRAGRYRDQQFEPPDCEGFYPTPLEENVTETAKDGRAYNCVTYTRTLYPTVAGDLQIGAWHWEGGASNGIQEWRIQRLAPAIPIRVLKLPDAPPGFSGAVGQFTLEAKLSRDDGVQGVPMQLTVTVRGKGNPDAVGAPQVPKVEKAYVSDPDRALAPAEPISADVEKTFVYSITPLESGALTIPPVQYCFFDPSTAAYKTQSSQPLNVVVRQSAEYGAGQHKLVKQENDPAPKGTVSVTGDDLFPLAAAPSGLRPVHRSGATAPLAAAVPVVLYAGVALLMQRKRRFERDPAYARARRAKAQGIKRLSAAANSAEPAEELYRALIGYVADRYNLNETGLTSQEVTMTLDARKVDPDVKEHVRKILRACERTRYGGSRLSGDELEALTRGATEAIERMEAAQ